MSKAPAKYQQDFLEKAHAKSSSHKAEILSGNLCACFYCEHSFLPGDIVEWIEEPKGGETAICPKCGIDSVLSDNLPIDDKEFLNEMNNYWFG